MSNVLSYELYRLYDMLIFYAHRFFNISSTLSIVEHTLEDENGHPILPTPEFCSDLQERLASMRQQCMETGLTLSVRQIDRIGMILSNTDPNVQMHANLGAQIQALAVRIQDELQDHVFMCLPKEREPYYSDPRGQFGMIILDKFPSIVTDVESAGRCYATGNPTAGVFHLMRVMECGLRALSRALNDPNLDPKRNPTWETILRRCDEELKKPLSQRSDPWRRDEQFYSESTANLRAVKDAWRNPTMHVEQVYDADQTLTVFNAVKAFMRHLATKLSE